MQTQINARSHSTLLVGINHDGCLRRQRCARLKETSRTCNTSHALHATCAHACITTVFLPPTIQARRCIESEPGANDCGARSGLLLNLVSLFALSSNLSFLFQLLLSNLKHRVTYHAQIATCTASRDLPAASTPRLGCAGVRAPSTHSP